MAARDALGAGLEAVFLVSPRTLAGTDSYLRALDAVASRHGREMVYGTDEIFPSLEDWLTYREETFKNALYCYVLAEYERPVGRGTYLDWEYMRGRGVGCSLLIAGETGPDSLHEYPYFDMEIRSPDSYERYARPTYSPDSDYRRELLA